MLVNLLSTNLKEPKACYTIALLNATLDDDDSDSAKVDFRRLGYEVVEM